MFPEKVTLFFIHPHVLATWTIITCGQPFLFSMNRVFMLEQTDEFLIALRTRTFVWLSVFWPTNRIQKCVCSNRVHIPALGTDPCGRHPFSSSVNGFIVVQPYCLGAAFRTFLFRWYHLGLLYSIAQNHVMVLKDTSPNKILKTINTTTADTSMSGWGR